MTFKFPSYNEGCVSTGSLGFVLCIWVFLKNSPLQLQLFLYLNSSTCLEIIVSTLFDLDALNGSCPNLLAQEAPPTWTVKRAWQPPPKLCNVVTLPWKYNICSFLLGNRFMLWDFFFPNSRGAGILSTSSFRVLLWEDSFPKHPPKSWWKWTQQEVQKSVILTPWGPALEEEKPSIRALLEMECLCPLSNLYVESYCWLGGVGEHESLGGK